MSAFQEGHQKEVEGLLTTISKHRDLIARGYSARRGAEFSPEEEVSVQLLRSLGLVRPTGDGQFRLSKQLRELINRGVNRHHIRDINVNLGEYLDSLELTINDYLAAKYSKDEIILENAIDEMVSVFYEIGDFFSDASVEIDQQVKLVIGNHAYGQERIRVIRAHLAKLDRLQEAHETITQLLDDEIYTEDPLLSDERIKFLARTLRYIDQVKSTHYEIKTVLHMREVREQRTQKLRLLDAYLRENPTAMFENTSENAVNFTFFQCIEPTRVQSFINFESNDHNWIEFYEQTIHALGQKKPYRPEHFTRPASGPTNMNKVLHQKEEAAAMKIINDLIRHIYTNKTAVSVTSFKHTHPLSGSVSHGYWLYISRMHPARLLLSPKSRLARFFKVTPIFSEHLAIEGNRRIKDVVISHIHASRTHFENLKSDIHSVDEVGS
ncbi:MULTISPECIES: hypothetical protein [Pseudoalteromonas]|uniref:hypothetical protein n=1 Tax=Pseudoalteromonas TaxID=53246 RepID=UPI000C5CD12D|nr:MULTISPECIES: hypothetical protein [Pseudoalteromonas]MAY59197.1 hypothetical protein [Pseudoalteromonas sp.]MDN3409049.1 hypothetical protein [Pseudoalteromonas sp. APC 3894]MDN3416555.1 hypothetical protein [Pseudoalteromonas sp. APC 3227]MDN3420252.1 hypothetical protein [Pseudoalteromonas sp. APC 3895]MDN3423725.1 hypothetical protein [Pseudoalteromonas sp. APC 3896]|tara:strand:+ start:33210 stop:34523 length:1314 start_codon:yes stop_codon:yes gene_type:complete